MFHPSTNRYNGCNHPPCTGNLHRKPAEAEAEASRSGTAQLRGIGVTAGNAIEAVGLVKHYGEKAALDGVSFEVPRGTVCALLGPNGAGKTTAVRILTTLPEGRRRLGDGRRDRRDRQPNEVRRRLGLAAQDATVDALLTGRENLVMMGELHHLGRAPRCARRRAAGAVLARRRRRPAGEDLLRRHAPAARPGGDAGRRPGCCSSTSPRPGSTRARGWSCGTCWTRWSGRAPRSC